MQVIGCDQSGAMNWSTVISLRPDNRPKSSTVKRRIGSVVGLRILTRGARLGFLW
jgi:hypothetical protein